MYLTIFLKTRPPQRGGREVVRVAGTEKHELVVRIPPAVGMRIVGIEPKPRIVGIQVEHIRVAVAVVMYRAPSVPPPIEGHAADLKIVSYAGTKFHQHSVPSITNLFEFSYALREKPWSPTLSAYGYLVGSRKP